MATEIYVEVDCIIRPCDPTGEACEGCDEVPYLNAEEIITFINGSEGERLVYVCRDCAEQLRGEDGLD